MIIILQTYYLNMHHRRGGEAPLVFENEGPVSEYTLKLATDMLMRFMGNSFKDNDIIEYADLVAIENIETNLTLVIKSLLGTGEFPRVIPTIKVTELLGYRFLPGILSWE